MNTKYIAAINDSLVDRIKSFNVEKNLTQYSGKFSMVVSDPINTLYDSVTSGDEIKVFGNNIDNTTESTSLNLGHSPTNWYKFNDDLTDSAGTTTPSVQVRATAYYPFNGQYLNSPIAYYPFDGSANDVIGDEDGTVTGAVLGTDRFGNANRAYVFANGDNIKIGDVISNTLVTVSAWVKSTSTSEMYFVAKGDVGESLKTNVQLFGSRENNNLRYFTETTASGTNHVYNIATSTNVVDGDWHHVVFVVNNTELNVYIDGVLEGTKTVVNTDSTCPTCWIGTNSGGTSNSWIGSIDDVLIYNKALTTTEVKSLYDVSSVKNINPVQDESTSGNNATNNSGATLTTDRFGVADKAYSFDGTSSTNIRVNPISFNFSTGFTLSFWVNPSSLASAVGGIFNFADASSNNIRGFINTNGILEVDQYPGEIGNRTATLSKDVWQHVCVTWNSTTTNLEIYVNGVISGNSKTAVFTFGTLTDFYLGRLASAHYYRGKIDEVIILPVALTPTEVAALYDTTSRHDWNDVFVDGKFQRAVELGGAGRYGPFINLTPGRAVDGDCSFSLWVKPKELIGRFAGRLHGSGASSRSGSFSGNWSGNNQFCWYIRQSDGTGVFAVDPDEYNLNEWYHLVGTAGNGKVNIYVNGVLKDSQNFNNTYTALSTGSTQIGISMDSANAVYHCEIDDVKIYTEEINASQVKLLYNNSNKIFGGYVEKIERDKEQRYTLYIDGGDYTTRLNDILVLAQVYNGREFSVIIRDLMNKYVMDTNIINNCDATTGWNETGATLSLETGDDANGYMIARLGEGCLKLVPSATTIALNRTTSSARDFETSDYVTMYLYVEDSTKVESLSLDIGQDNSNYYNIEYTPSDLANGWNYIEFDLSAATTGAGSPSLLDVDYYNINITLSDTTNTIYIDDFRQTPNGTENYTLSNVSITPYYTDIKYKNVTMFEAIKQICEIRPNTFDFYIDVNKVLNFGVFGAIDSGQTLQRGVNVLKSEFWDDDTKLFNKVTVYGAKQEFNLTETFDGDGTTKEFVLTYEPITQTVSVGGVEKKGYVQGMSPTEYDYRVDKENRTIILNSAPGVGSDNVSVNYTYGVPIIVQRQDDVSIDNYKLRETKIENEHLLTKDDVRIVAQEYIETWANPILNAKFNIRINPEIDIGENVTIIDEKYFGDSTPRSFGVVSLKHSLIGNRSGTELSLTQITKSVEMYLQDIFTRLNALEEKDKGDRDVLARLLFFSDDLNLQDDPASNLSIQVRSIAGEAGIWDNINFGIWDTSKWSDGAYETSFILGNTFAAVLGSSKLGNITSDWGDNLVTNPSD